MKANTESAQSGKCVIMIATIQNILAFKISDYLISTALRSLIVTYYKFIETWETEFRVRYRQGIILYSSTPKEKLFVTDIHLGKWYFFVCKTLSGRG